MSSETISPAPGETRGAFPEREASRAIIGYTVPSVEVFTLLRHTSDANSESPTVLEKSRWVSYLAEAARISADNQYELGRRLGYYPEGIIINGAYTYSFQPEKIKAEAKARGALVSTRDYKPTITPQISPQTEHFWKLSGDNHSLSDGQFRDGGAGEYVAELMFNILTNQRPEGPISFQSVYGLPNLSVSRTEDLHALRPDSDLDLPPETQAFSFVIYRSTDKVEKTGLKSGFPLVVSLDSCPVEVRRRHIATQLLFENVARPQGISPILISTDPSLGISAENGLSRFNQELDRKLKDWWILKELIEQRQPADWLEDESDIRTKTFLAAHRREIFLPGELSLTDWIDIPFGTRKEEEREKKNGIWEVASTKLEAAAALLGSMIHQLPSIEYQLVITNYLSFFPMSDWDEARDMLAEYEMATGRKFKNFFRIPILRRTGTEGTSTPLEDIQADAPEPIASEETNSELES